MVGIYHITNLKSGKVYIGQSTDIYKRFRDHKEALNGGYHQNRYLQNAWNKHGEANFIFGILEECAEEDLVKREQFWIDFYGGIDDPANYNLREAGSRGKVSDETRKIMSDKIKKLRQDPDWVARNSEGIKRSWTDERRQYMSKLKTGSKASEETRKKMSEARKGKPRSEETKRKISETLKGRSLSEETKQKISNSVKKTIKNKPPFKHAEETKRKISEALKGRPRSEETKQKIRLAAIERWKKKKLI